MKKTVLCILLTVCTLLSLPTYAAEYTDVPKSSGYYTAIKTLGEKGIISGYEDGTFRPANKITRAETAALLIRAMGMEGKKAPKSVFSDVTEDFWGKSYIMLAAEEGIINGYGNGLFGPADNVTYNQVIKMLVCMAGVEEYAEKDGGWPTGYVETAYRNAIINRTIYDRVMSRGYGEKDATREDVAQFLYDTIIVPDSKKLTVGGNEYHIGMDAGELGTPDEMFLSTESFTWYVFGTDTYKNFFAAGVQDGRVAALVSVGAGFSYNGYEAGDTDLDSQSQLALYLATDKNDNDSIHAVEISNKRGDVIHSAKALAGESKMNFHCTNAFRVYHGVEPLLWSEEAAEAASLHSQDMADRDYFSHNNLDGLSVSKRIEAQGVDWSSCGENISAGRSTGFDAYCGWVNSDGHRTNMLRENYVYLGVGSGHNSDSTYQWYCTQDFYK